MVITHLVSSPIDFHKSCVENTCNRCVTSTFWQCRQTQCTYHTCCNPMHILQNNPPPLH